LSNKANLYVIAAPSGAGKTSLVKALVQKLSHIKISVSSTTRPPRPNDVEGVDYCFISKESFDQKIHEGDFLEHAEVYGNYYGTSRSWVMQQLAEGNDVILEIDWQGAQQIRRWMPDSISIFILPPSIEILEQRLIQRQQDNESVIKKRLDLARSEIAHIDEFDYLVVNADFEKALDDLLHIVRAGRLRTVSQCERQAELLRGLLGSEDRRQKTEDRE